MSNDWSFSCSGNLGSNVARHSDVLKGVLQLRISKSNGYGFRVRAEGVSISSYQMEQKASGNFF